MYGQVEDPFAKGLIAVATFFAGLEFFGDQFMLEQLWSSEVAVLWLSLALVIFSLLLTEGGGIRLLIFLFLGIVAGESRLRNDLFNLALFDIGVLMLWLAGGFHVILWRMHDNQSRAPTGRGNEGRRRDAVVDAFSGIGYSRGHWLNRIF